MQPPRDPRGAIISVVVHIRRPDLTPQLRALPAYDTHSVVAVAR